MNKKVMKTAATDRLILANAEKLISFTDRADLLCRNSQRIDDAYHKDWFFEFNGESYFTPPAVYIQEGVIKFINGRHRTILLARYLTLFPVLVGHLDLDHHGGVPRQESIDALNEIMTSEFEEHATFSNLPELECGNFPQP
ncbi:hypothetical protein ONV78_30480 [Hahella sp. CR1]|uniref:hypothetical protein n=1 Tax=Hahella sp. CR1 TaxID=2992807 RepID=UPI002441416A|nr:hypothetical protein [Hahella sp. CR1]MDG9672099.1 hypothetical protein [Hahella sp. CR1]